MRIISRIGRYRDAADVALLAHKQDRQYGRRCLTTYLPEHHLNVALYGARQVWPRASVKCSALRAMDTVLCLLSSVLCGFTSVQCTWADFSDLTGFTRREWIAWDFLAARNTHLKVWLV